MANKNFPGPATTSKGGNTGGGKNGKSQSTPKEPATTGNQKNTKKGNLSR